MARRRKHRRDGHRADTDRRPDVLDRPAGMISSRTCPPGAEGDGRSPDVEVAIQAAAGPQESTVDVVDPGSTRQLPILKLLIPEAAEPDADRDVQACLADMHCESARALRADADTLMTRFPRNDLAHHEAVALRADAALLLRSARALAELARHELPKPLLLTG